MPSPRLWPAQNKDPLAPDFGHHFSFFPSCLGDMSKVFFVDHENKCQNFIKRCIDDADRIYKAKLAKGLPPEFHVHLFYRADGPKASLPRRRKKWMTFHPIPPIGKNAADYALIEAVRNYPLADGDAIYIVCGGDKIYRNTFRDASCTIIEVAPPSLRPFLLRARSALLFAHLALLCSLLCSLGWDQPTFDGLSPHSCGATLARVFSALVLHISCLLRYGSVHSPLSLPRLSHLLVE